MRMDKQLKQSGAFFCFWGNSRCPELLMESLSGIPYTSESLIVFIAAAECNFCLSLDNSTRENHVMKMYAWL